MFISKPTRSNKRYIYPCVYPASAITYLLMMFYTDLLVTKMLASVMYVSLSSFNFHIKTADTQIPYCVTNNIFFLKCIRT
jgi:hypothetical protein